VIRVGAVTATAERFAATIRGVRDSLAGYRRAVIDLGERHDSATNTQVLSALARRNPSLLDGLQPAAMAAVRLRWSQGGIRTGLEELTLHAGLGAAHEIASRLRSGDYVTNTSETRERKRRQGLSSTPGVATGALASALDNARVRVE
jgi:hypothetical protein